MIAIFDPKETHADIKYADTVTITYGVSVTINDVAATYTQIVITTPLGVQIEANKLYQLKVTTVNGNEGVNGLIFPPLANVGLQICYLRTYIQTAPPLPIPTESAEINFHFYGKDYTKFDAQALIKNPGEISIYHFRFQPETQHAGNWKLKIHFETRSLTGRTLFSNDLGTGIATNGAIHCRSYSNMPTPTCKLIHGNQDFRDNPAIIEVTWTGNLNTGTLYEFQIFQIVNPPTPSDDRHIEMVMHGVDNTGAIKNSGVFYDFTLSKTDAWTTTNSLASSYAPVANTRVVENGFQWTGKLKSINAL